MPAEPQQSSGLGDLAQLQAGDAAQQRARLGADALRVRRGGRRRGRRRVIGSGCRGGDRAELGEQLGDVAHLGGERRRPLGVRRVVGEQVGVLLHRRAAAGRVDDDVLDAGPSNASMVPAGERLRLRLAAVVHATARRSSPGRAG